MTRIAVSVVALLLLFSLTSASRKVLMDPSDSPLKTQQGGGAEMSKDVEEGCEGVGVEECLMKRTVGAHIDYIYGQGNNSP
ncbi:phytosulfokines-like protein [Cinnamomum micranthum f. kanehirae]|uniref:Phytosulfokine n=1 Tax=Cinnamomum micranthum f. kanehirae TaxID=337451 RepID=A0A443NVH8_9MAGN|nr:phytosulfokines-like protein [Cinnamomum micranthum f. kanehirae]